MEAGTQVRRTAGVLATMEEEALTLKDIEERNSVGPGTAWLAVGGGGHQDKART